MCFSDMEPKLSINSITTIILGEAAIVIDLKGMDLPTEIFLFDISREMFYLLSFIFHSGA